MPDGDSISGQFINIISDTKAITIFIALSVLFIVISFLYSMFIGAVDSASVSTVKKQADSGISSAKRAMKFFDNDTNYIRKANFLRMMCVSLSMIFSVPGIIFYTTDKLVMLFGNFTVSAVVSFVVSIIIFGIISGSLGILLPEKMGQVNAEKIITKLSGLYRFMFVLALPLTAVSCAISDVIAGLYKKDTEKGSNQQTEEDILFMVDEGEENGFIEGNTKDMIENIFEFDDTTVGEIMTHRKDVVAVREDATVSDVTELAIKSGRSRIPVYKDDIDDITGIIHVKDLLKYVTTNAPQGAISKDIIKEAVFVPESKRCSEMFEYMTAHKTQIAVVVDEFGGTGGIITMEDLIESIVGSIQDEYDNEDEDIKKLGEHSFTVDGATSLDEISELTGVLFDDDENDTIAGFMLDKLGRIPENGEHPSLMIKNTRFTVLEVSNLRISKVMVVLN